MPAALHRRPMIVVGPDRNLLRQLFEGAEMIAVPVRGDVMVDLREARVLDRFHDASRIPGRRRCRRCWRR